MSDMNQDPNNLVQIVPTSPETTPLIPQEPELPTEEPVMIAANIDEMPAENLQALTQTTPVEQAPVPQETVAGPDLGQPEKQEEETVPTFQQLGDVPVEGATTPAVEIEQNPTTTPVPVINNLTETYQQGEPSTAPFQQLGVFSETTDTPTTMETTPQEEVKESQPVKNKKKKFIPILVLIMVVALIGGGLSIGLTHLSKLGKEEYYPTIKPTRSEDGNTNIVMIGSTDAGREEVLALMTKLYGEEKSVIDLSSCPEQKGNYLTYNSEKVEIATTKKYNIFLPCSIEDQMKILMNGDGEDTTDGVVLVLKAENPLDENIKKILVGTKNIGIEKLIIYVVGDKTLIEDALTTMLEESGYDSGSIPVVVGTLDNEENIKELMNTVDTQVIRIVEENAPTAIQSMKSMKLYTYIRVKEEGGTIDEISSEEKSFTYQIGEEKIKGTLTVSEKEQPGVYFLSDLELEEAKPLEVGMRIPIYKESKYIGVGVIHELK